MYFKDKVPYEQINQPRFQTFEEEELIQYIIFQIATGNNVLITSVNSGRGQFCYQADVQE